MADFQISVDMSDVLAEVDQVINGTVLPRLAQAVRMVAEQTSIDWKEAVARAKLWDGEKKPYIESIHWHMRGDFTATIWSRYYLAEQIESGRPARDMKRMLNTSLKVRFTKNGTRYLIIPFRHGAPGTNHSPMSPAVYAAASQLTASRVVSVGRRISGLVAFDIKTHKMLTVKKRNYSWGGQLERTDAPGVGRTQVGMVRFDTSSGKAKSSSYLTFRVMSEKSSGWIIPAQPGQFIVKGVVDRMQPMAEKIFQQAIKLDLG